MALKLVGDIASITNARGLPPLQKLGVQVQWAVQNPALQFVLAQGWVELRAGEETPIELHVAGLASNANVEAIRARLRVADSQAPPPPSAGTATVTEGNTPRTFTVSVAPQVRPSAFQLRLENGAPIFTHDALMSDDTYAVADFAAAANAFLDAAAANAPALAAAAAGRLRFLAKSATAGRIHIEIDAGDFSATLIQAQAWENPLDQTLRLDRTLNVDFGKGALWALDTPATPTGGRVARVSLTVAGTLGPERVLGEIAVAANGQSAIVSPDYALAQALRLADAPALRAALGAAPGVQCAGLLLLAFVQGEGELYLALQPDDNGKPALGAPLAQGTVQLPAPAGELSAPTWIYAPFAAPADLDANALYWAVLKGVRGRIDMVLEEGANAARYTRMARSSRSSNLWRRLDGRNGPESSAVSDSSALAAALRIVFVPTADTQAAALLMSVSGGAVQRVDPTPTPQEITLAVPAGITLPAVLELRALGRGEVHLAQVVQEVTNG